MKSALVLSPFATYPADAGQRKRAHQVTALLRDQGYEITFLFYAFEGIWYNGSDAVALKRMRDEWGEVIHFPADRSIGLPPKNRAFHSLDEWWSTSLEEYVKRLFQFRHFDAMVVHNVWLSKALDLCPPTCCRIIETHDLFWLRNDYYKAGVIKPEFFVIDQTSELAGLRRSDLVVTIQITEFDLLQNALPEKATLNIPYVIEADLLPLRQRSYLASDRVSFGVMGSEHGFNVAGLSSLLKALKESVKRTFAPVEVVIAGKLSMQVAEELALVKLGYVQQEDEFYNLADFVFVPNFSGTGFNVKVADAIARSHPLLCAAHAAVGMPLAADTIFSTPEEMADAMCEIALARPDLGSAAALVKSAHDKLVEEATLAAAHLDVFIMNVRPAMVIDLTKLSISTGAIRIMFWIAFAETDESKRKTFILLPEPLWREVRGVVSEKVIYTTIDDARLATLEHGTAIDVRANKTVFLRSLESRDSEASQITIDDNRVVAEFDWHPCQTAIKKIAAQTNFARKASNHIVFVHGVPPIALQTIFSESLFVDVDSTIFDEVMVHLAVTEPCKIAIIWLATSAGNKRQTAIQLATLRGIECEGLLRDGSIIKPLGSLQINESRDRALREVETSRKVILSCLVLDTVTA